MGKHRCFHLSFFQIVGAWRDFTVVTKLIKNFKSLYGFGGGCLKIWDVCMDFEPYFKVHNSVHPKSIILGQMTNLNMVFHGVVSLSIAYNLKLTPVPCWISERPIYQAQKLNYLKIPKTSKRLRPHPLLLKENLTNVSQFEAPYHKAVQNSNSILKFPTMIRLDEMNMMKCSMGRTWWNVLGGVMALLARLH